MAPRLEASLGKIKNRVPVELSSLKDSGPGLGSFEKTKLGFLGVEFVMKEDGSETNHYLLFDRDWHLLYEIT